METNKCTEQIDELRDMVDKNTVNYGLWIAMIAIQRDVCKAIGAIESAVLGDGNGNKGMYDILKEMATNQNKRAEDHFNIKRILIEKVFPSVLSAVIIGLGGAVVGWWLAVNELLKVGAP